MVLCAGGSVSILFMPARQARITTRLPACVDTAPTRQSVLRRSNNPVTPYFFLHTFPNYQDFPLFRERLVSGVYDATQTSNLLYQRDGA